MIVSLRGLVDKKPVRVEGNSVDLPLERNRGGDVVRCTSGLTISRSRGRTGITVHAADTASNRPVCDGYLEPGNPKCRSKYSHEFSSLFTFYIRYNRCA